MLSGFRDFVLRGNVIDLAVALVLGLAFVGAVNSFVADILAPLLGLVGVPDFGEIATTLPSGAVIRWGVFLNALIAFLIVALVIYFLIVVPMNRIKGPAAIETKACSECTSDIPLGARRCPFCTQPQHVA